MAAFRTLRHDLLDNIMLRRTKEERKKDLQLPPIKVQGRSIRGNHLVLQRCVREAEQNAQTNHSSQTERPNTVLSYERTWAEFFEHTSLAKCSPKLFLLHQK
eukprot:3873439-Amphidinium_carterae.1